MKRYQQETKRLNLSARRRSPPMRSYLDGRTMDDVAMERLRCFEPDAIKKHPNGYWLAFSDGITYCDKCHKLLGGKGGVL